ncbi:DUF924 family protein [Pseudoteredinibacter isoporae]|uniref:DUF924 family protein n=1 Tax=Pseudoteredinibacter isoporae TaxID=570281 RepID=UPI003103FE25
MTNTWIDDVLSFWFHELEPRQWFVKDDALDHLISTRFSGLHAERSGNNVSELIGDARTALAAIILFDQFSRNMFRGTAQSFASDGIALEIARHIVDQQWDESMNKNERSFVYLPFEHSENMADQDRAVELMSALGDENQTYYAHAHRDIIARFGRFPHRNDILGRTSTAEELTFLSQPNSGF